MNFPDELIQLLRRVSRAAALTGAGVSQESGLRTFRDAQTGIWQKYRPEDLATPEAFMKDPQLVWDWYAWRRSVVSEVVPNPGHYALVEMAIHIPKFTLITQNVDGLHKKAGSPQVIELHGNIQRVKCFTGCGVVEEWNEASGIVPRCSDCGSMLRPDVVWFGEQLPLDALEEAVLAARSSEVFFSIGTSGIVQPAASLAHSARNQGAMIVEINYEHTPLSQLTHYSILGKSGEVLPDLVRAVWPGG